MTTRAENSQTMMPPAGRWTYFLLSFIVAVLALLCNQPVSILDDWNVLMQDFCLRTFNRECQPLSSIFDMGSAEGAVEHDTIVLNSVAIMSEYHQRNSNSQAQQQQQQKEQKQSSQSSIGTNQIGNAVSSNWKNPFQKQQQQQHQIPAEEAEEQSDSSFALFSSKFLSSNGVLTSTAKYYLHYRNATLQGLLDMRHISLADMTDRIAHSTPRLLALCNLILAVSYMMHCSVADFFSCGAKSCYFGEWSKNSVFRIRLFGDSCELLFLQAVVG